MTTTRTSEPATFEFGKNWANFLSVLDENRIREAENSLKNMLGKDRLDGLKFLDIGSGSGLFSLAARRLGAEVFSFDYDRDSVGCTSELKNRYFPDDDQWLVEQGSILDEDYLKKFSTYDIVYSWGVLHHTGNMWQALENARRLVADDGLLFIAIYNDQDFISRFWIRVKKTYNSGFLGKALVLAVFIPYFCFQGVAIGIKRNGNPFSYYLNNKRDRGMSIWYDWVDWLGGWPFEVAKPEEIFEFYKSKGFELIKLVTTNRQGCNQFVFRKHN